MDKWEGFADGGFLMEFGEGGGVRSWAPNLVGPGDLLSWGTDLDFEWI